MIFGNGQNNVSRRDYAELDGRESGGEAEASGAVGDG